MEDKNWKAGKISFYNALEYIIDKSGGCSAYDIRSYGKPEVDLGHYLNSMRDTLKFHPNKTYVKSNGVIFEYMSEDFMKRDCVETVEKLLALGFPTLIY